LKSNAVPATGEHVLEGHCELDKFVCKLEQQQRERLSFQAHEAARVTRAFYFVGYEEAARIVAETFGKDPHGNSVFTEGEIKRRAPTW
jgi:hypothetical protein